MRPVRLLLLPMALVLPLAALSPLAGASAATGPVAQVSSPDDAALGLPASRLVFSTVASAARPARGFTIRNSGDSTLTVSGIAITGDDATSWRLATGEATSRSVAPGASTTVNLVFVPTASTGCPTDTDTLAVGDVERYGTVTFQTNETGTPTRSMALGGINACNYEGNREPLLGPLVRALGYTTDVNSGSGDVRFMGPLRWQAGSDEVQVPYFVRADTSQPVRLSPVAHYGGKNTSSGGYTRTGWYAKSATVATPCTPTCTELWRLPGDTSSGYVENQKLMPVPMASGTTTFSPSGAFGLWSGDYGDVNYTDDGKNYDKTSSGDTISPVHYLHDIRVYPAFGPGHVQIPNTYLLGIDITRVSAYHNNDYQDVVLVLRNAKPEVGRASAPGSSSLTKDLTTGGTVSSTCAVTFFDGVLANGDGSQCRPAGISYSSAGLKLTSTAGQLGGTSNRQQNALYKKFDATRGAFTVTTRVKGPVNYLTQNYQQVAAFFGPDQDNYVKVEAEHNGGGTDPHISMYFEEKASGSTVATVSVPGLTSASTLDLVIRGNTSVPDPTPSTDNANKVRGYPLDEVTVGYKLNGGSLVTVGSVRRPTDVTGWFSTSAKAGILVSGGNSTTPFSSTFTNFSITSG